MANAEAEGAGEDLIAIDTAGRTPLSRAAGFAQSLLYHLIA